MTSRGTRDARGVHSAGVHSGGARSGRPQRLRQGRRDRHPALAVLREIRMLPNYVKLLVGLLFDRRVSPVDKLLVGAAVAYVLSPITLIPDVIPIIGELDDLFIVTFVLQRLIANTPEEVLLDHWSGDPRDISELNVGQAMAAAALFLPGRMRRRLRRIVRG